MLRSRRWKTGVPLMLALAVLAVFTLRWGLASLDIWRATRVLDQLASADTAVQSRAGLLQTGLDYLDRAQRLGGNHPDVFDNRGQLLFWQATNLAEVGRERADLLAQATEQYRQAVASRPLWPYFWANLVVAKAEWGIFDQEFRTAVRRTVETGPWEPRVQLQLIRVDFIEQQRLDRLSRARINEMLIRALGTQPGAVMKLASSLGQQPRICAMPEAKSLRSHCKRLGLDATAATGGAG